MAPKTLSQAIDHLAALAGTFDPNAGPVLTPLLAACRDVADARRRLDGLEEARALIASRGTAFERARELVADDGVTDIPAILEVARFLCPGLEVVDDPDLLDLGPNSTRSELEASEAGAVAQADELEDKVAALELELAEYRDPTNWQRVALWGETYGRMLKDDAEKLSTAIQEELTKRSAIAQVADDRRRTIEAELANEKAEGDSAREHATELAATLETTERELADERSKLIDLTERSARWENSARRLNPLFGGPRIDEDLEDLDTLNRAGVGVHGDRIAFVVWGQELEREEALVVAANIVALADRGEGLFTAVYRKVVNA